VILAAEAQTGPNTPLPRIATASGQIAVGTDIIVLGYPFAPVGSFLETWSPGCVVALARRNVLEGVTVDEAVLSIQDQPGLAGSAVTGRQDGVVHGISAAPSRRLKSCASVTSRSPPISPSDLQ